MIPRRQLPVYSPLSGSALLAGLRSAITAGEADHAFIASSLAATFHARQVVLTDSGTSALVMALRMLVEQGRTVALPAYSCVDLASAAVHARVRVRFYDIDPATLSPDLDSVSRVLREGVDAVVVAHLYGFPADVPAVTEMAAAHGVPVIEDAAQGAGGELRGSVLGSFGAVTILSFGRGKGLTGGSGGALLVVAPDGTPHIEPADHRIRHGWRDLAVAASQWMLGRPALYAVPGAIPGLRLGEMVYHSAREPGALSAAAAALIRATLPLAESELVIRRRNAESLMAAAGTSEAVRPVRPIVGGASGYLRFPVCVLRPCAAVPRLGIVRGYPRALLEQEELRPWLHRDEVVPTGAAELRRTMFTLPVHGLLTERDVMHLGEWLRSQAPGRTHGKQLARVRTAV